MAKINDNIWIQGARGSVGKQLVYRKRGNNTILARFPEVKKISKSSEQQKTRDLFAAAAQFAKSVISNHVMKREYQEKAGPSNTAYNIALRDYLKAPTVHAIDSKGFDGSAGSTLIIVATDDFRVGWVKLRISYADGTLAAEGNAVLDAIDRTKWIYTCAEPVAMEKGIIIRATAIDIPGNKTKLEINL